MRMYDVAEPGVDSLGSPLTRVANQRDIYVIAAQLSLEQLAALHLKSIRST